MRTLGASAGLMALGNADSAFGSTAIPPPADLDSLVGSKGIDWQKLKQSFLLAKGLVYMNNGSLGPSPSYVLEEIFQAWRTLEQNPVEEGYGPLLEKAEGVRTKAASFLGCSPDEIAITQCTTEGMNAVAQGLNLQAGQHVLTTDQEHPGGLVGWQYFAMRNGVVIDTVPLPLLPRDSGEIMSLIQARLTKQTRVISVSHVTFTTGLQLPIAEIAALAQTNGSFLIVDGAQAPGGLTVDVKKLGCHAYATSAHKWMLAPMGTGLLYISDMAKNQIDPILLAAGRRVYTANTGTRNLPAMIGLGAAIDFLNKLGKENVEKRCLELRARLYGKLNELPKIKVVSPPAGPFASPLVTIELPKEISNATLADQLRKKHSILVKVVPTNHVNGLRISTHIYNSEQDIDKLATALRTELA
jgi:selenocysteine lyase/cysteine desulfurase